MSEHKWEVGQKAIVHFGRDGRAIVTVTKVGKIHVTARWGDREWKFNIRTGCEVGSLGHYYSAIKPATPEEVAEIRDKIERKRLVGQIEAAIHGTENLLTTETLRQIVALLDGGAR